MLIMNHDMPVNWNLTPREAIELQQNLAASVSRRSGLRLSAIRLVAGADVSYSKKTDSCYAALCILTFPDLSLVETRTLRRKARFPYVPGLLSFREAPPLIEAFQRLSHTPDVLICDGQGIAHPRGIGLASHVGLLLDVPSVGCAKTRLYGAFEAPGAERGDWASLRSEANTGILGCVLRSRRCCNPLFISPGHRMSVSFARRIVMKCLSGYRLPEPTRLAHLAANELRRKYE